MSLFGWFSSKSDASEKAASGSTSWSKTAKPTRAQDKSLPPVIRAALSSQAKQVDRKVKRHAQREQLGITLREGMTRAGVLSASYKFKVMSVEQGGDHFLVLMDVAPDLISRADKLADIETLLISTAKSLFGIVVTSVYWRTDNSPAVANALNLSNNQLAAHQSAPLPFEVAKPALKDSGAQRLTPIHDDDMAAEQHPATSDIKSKSRSGLRSYTLITGFEDTEMPESSAARTRSASQLGQLR